jgi:ribosomal subunit interface protein
MNIYQLIGRNIEITDAMRSYAEDKLQRLDRFFDQIVDARVVMSYDERVGGEPAKVEVQVNVPNGIVRAEERGVDTYAAVDLVVDKLERQLKRFKQRLRGKRGEAPPVAGRRGAGRARAGDRPHQALRAAADVAEDAASRWTPSATLLPVPQRRHRPDQRDLPAARRRLRPDRAGR